MLPCWTRYEKAETDECNGTDVSPGSDLCSLLADEEELVELSEDFLEGSNEEEWLGEVIEEFLLEADDDINEELKDDLLEIQSESEHLIFQESVL